MFNRATQALEAFVTTNALCWLEVLSLLGQSSIGVVRAREAKQWALASSSSQNVISLLDDVNRLVLQFHKEIASGPDVVYHTALPFCPQDTELYKAYSPLVGDRMRVIRGTDATWPMSLSTNSDIVEAGGSNMSPLDTSHLASSVRSDVSRPTAIGALQQGSREESIKSIVFSSDGTRVAAASDNAIKVWDARSGEWDGTLEGHPPYQGCMAFSSDGAMLALSFDGTVHVWQVTLGNSLVTLDEQLDNVYNIRFSPSGSCLASVSPDKAVRIWNPMSGACTKTLTGHKLPVKTIAFSPVGLDGSLLASGARDSTVRIWDTVTGDCLKILEGHSDWVYTVAFSLDGEWLASGSEDKAVRIWNVMSGSCATILAGHTCPVHTVTFSSSGSKLITRSKVEALEWVTSSFSGSAKPFSRPARRSQVVGCYVDQADQMLYIYAALKNPVPMAIYRVPEAYSVSRAVVFGQTVALGCEDGQVLILDLSNVDFRD